jgi:glycosyltransferase involved in cell wall biosynthesis
MRTLWLADHLLVSERGHHVSYNGFIADSASRFGMNVRILCARGCKAQVPGGFPMRGIFRPDWRNDPSPLLSRSRLALDALDIFARRRFESDLRKGIRPDDVRREDIIFAEMLAPRNLAGWLRWLEAFPKNREPTLVLHLGYGSERFGAQEDIPLLLGRLKRSGKLPRAQFVTDSEMLKQKYEAILQRPVSQLPVVISRRASECYKAPGDPPHFASLGNAREEKGFAEILAAIDILNANGRPPHARFTLQSSDPDATSSTALANFRSAKANSLCLVTSPLSDESYLRLLREVDILLLPYHLKKYHDRSSGVFCEARTSGKPVITTEGSYLGFEVRREGTGWLAQDRDADSLAKAIRQAINEFEAVATRCRELMPRYQPMFHPDTFLAKLLSLVDEQG